MLEEIKKIIEDECVVSDDKMARMMERIQVVVDAENAWQPIETAPMDNSIIIVCFTNDGGYTKISGGLYSDHGTHYGHKPTHWKPLPKPPKEQ